MGHNSLRAGSQRKAVPAASLAPERDITAPLCLGDADMKDAVWNEVHEEAMIETLRPGSF